MRRRVVRHVFCLVITLGMGLMCAFHLRVCPVEASGASVRRESTCVYLGDISEEKTVEREVSADVGDEIDLWTRVKGKPQDIVPYAPGGSVTYLGRIVQDVFDPPARGYKGRTQEYLVEDRFRILTPDTRLVLRSSAGTQHSVIVGSGGSGGDLMPLGYTKVAPLPSPAIGTLSPQVVLVYFPDRLPMEGSTPDYFQNWLFSQLPGAASLYNYYKDASYNQLFLYGSVCGWICMPQRYAYYNGGEDKELGVTFVPHVEEFEQTVISEADAMVDFTQHDGDKDGKADGLIIIYAGAGRGGKEWGEGLWPHAGKSDRLVDGITLGHYFVQGEYSMTESDRGTPASLQCTVHEYGHVLGAMDFYDYDHSSSGTDTWSLMSGGSTPPLMDPWHRTYLGWVTPTVISFSNGQPVQYSVESADGITPANTVYRIPVRGDTEYFLVENRQKSGWDMNLSGSGILIWHIDESVTTGNSREWYPPGHTSDGHYFAAVEQADGAYLLEKTSEARQGFLFECSLPTDPWPGRDGRREFTESTVPDTRDYNGVDSGIRITDISSSASVMTFTATILQPQPTISIVRPEPYDAWEIGALQTIGWEESHTRDADIQVFFRNHAASEWQLLKTLPIQPDRTNTTAWTVAGEPSDDCYIRVVNGSYLAADDVGPFSVVAAPPSGSALTITSSSSRTPGTTGIGYEDVLDATGGAQPYVWSVSSGALPAGLVLAAATGEITGIPTTGGTFHFVVTVTDAALSSRSKPMSMVVYDNTLPLGVVVTSPTSGEHFDGGTSCSITWTVAGDPSDLAGFVLGYSIDGGTTYDLANGEEGLVPASARSYTWTLPNMDAPACKVLVGAIAGDGSILGGAESRGFFSIGAIQLDRWTQLLLCGGDVRCIAVDPIVPSTMYMCANNDDYSGRGGGVFRSVDGGSHWAVTGLADQDVLSVSINPLLPSTIYATRDVFGVFRSTDSGATWIAANAGLQGVISCLAFDPLNSSTLYAGTCGSASGSGVYRSTDNGTSWTAASAGNGYVYCLAVDPIRPSTLYAGTEAYQGGVRRSRDGGTTWTPANGGLAGLDVRSLVIDPAASTLYAGTHAGIFRSTDSGDHWTVTGLVNKDVRSVVIDPISCSTLYAVTDGAGAFRSTDSGATWAAVNTCFSLARHQVRSLVIDPISCATLYAGTTGSGLFRSVDSGTTWRSVNTGLADRHVLCLAIDPLSSSILYVSTPAGLSRSVDSGVTWTSLAERVFLALAVDPAVPSTLYGGTDGAGVFRSTDSGNTWAATNTGLVDLHIQCLAIDSFVPSTLYVGTAHGVFRSMDSGTTWVTTSIGLPDVTIRALAIDPVVSSTLYAATNGGGVLRSRDGGSTWVAVNSGLTEHYMGTYVYALAVDPLSHAVLYAGTYGAGVFRSGNAGDQWNTVTTGLGDPYIQCLAINPSASSTIYAGTNADGCYRYVSSRSASLSFALAVNVAGSGSVTKDPDQPTYAHDTVVTLIATPAVGHHFVSWTGATPDEMNPLKATVTMDADKSVTAVFAIDTHTLLIGQTGSGSVSRNPSQATYDYGTVVTLTATPSPGYTFTGWSGALTGLANPATITMDADKSVTATFTAMDPLFLTLTSPNGAESWAPGSVQNLTWSVTGDTSAIHHFSLYYTVDGGNSWERVLTAGGAVVYGAPTDRSYAWTVPDRFSSHAKVIVYAMNAASSMLAYDASDAFFTMAPAGAGTLPGIALLHPSAESWTAGTTQTISWSVAGSLPASFHHYSVYASLEDGRNGSWFNVGFSTVPSLSWIIPAAIGSAHARIVVYAMDATSHLLSDAFPASFVITPATGSFSMDVTAPAGGAILHVGAVTGVTWTTSGTVPPQIASYRVWYSVDGGLSWELAGTGTSSPYSWTVPVRLSSSCSVRVVALDASSNVLGVATSSTFTIAP